MAVKRVRCEACGRYMWCPQPMRYVPFEVQLYLDLGGSSDLVYYECSCGHGCAWYVPPIGENKEFIVKRANRKPMAELF